MDAGRQGEIGQGCYCQRWVVGRSDKFNVQALASHIICQRVSLFIVH